MCTWYLVAHRSCCRKNSWRDLGCHIDLGTWGICSLRKLGVRAVVTSEQSPHLLLPLTTFGPQGHKIPFEIQPCISSDECALYRATCDSSRQETYIRTSPQHLTGCHQTLFSPTLHLSMTRMGQETKPCDETRNFWENREGTMGESTWYRTTGHYSTQCTGEQPFCQDLTERRRTTVRFLGQQSEVTIDDTWPRVGEMRSLWKGTTEFWTNDMPQDDTWRTQQTSQQYTPALSQSLDSKRS